MRKNEALKILGVDASASQDDIKKAYRKLAMKHHPDREGGNEAEFKKAKEAFEFLEKGGEEQDLGTPHGAWRTWNSNSFSGDSMEDVIRKMREHADFRQNQQRIMSATIDITMLEALNGCTKKVSIPGMSEATQITIQPGIDERAVVKTIDTGPDVFRISVKIKSPFTIDWGETDKFKRGNASLEIEVSAIKMMLGGWEEVNTPDGSTVSVRIPAGLETNKQLKCKGKGYWRDVNSHERGDLFLWVLPKIQKVDELSPEELKSLKEALNESNTEV